MILDPDSGPPSGAHHHPARSPRRSRVEEAVAALRAGALVVIPTDTVYGVAALPRSPGGIAALFAAKGRPESKPVPVLGAGKQDLYSVGALDPRAEALADRFWPGPLTLVIPRAPGFDVDLGGGDQDTVAVRVPASEVARALLAASGPLAVTSANRSGEAPATTVAEARAALGDAVSVFLDGGPCGGEASTVLSAVGEPQVLREGPVTYEQVRRVLHEVRLRS
jgi:L-threonylcarbamoyladenylate synthase